MHAHYLSSNMYYLFRAYCARKDYHLFLKKGKVIDFGCGLGAHMFYIKHKTIGVEISNFAINFCKRKGLKVMHYKKFIKSNIKVDNILCIHTLEHLNPKKFLRLFKKHLKNKDV